MHTSYTLQAFFYSVSAWDKLPKEYPESAYIYADSTPMSAYGVKGAVENILVENADTYDSHVEHIQESGTLFQLTHWLLLWTP